jgi:hypothetical protein
MVEKIEPSTWPDPPIQTYKVVGPKLQGSKAAIGCDFVPRARLS